MCTLLAFSQEILHLVWCSVVTSEETPRCHVLPPFLLFIGSRVPMSTMSKSRNLGRAMNNWAKAKLIFQDHFLLCGPSYSCPAVQGSWGSNDASVCRLGMWQREETQSQVEIILEGGCPINRQGQVIRAGFNLGLTTSTSLLKWKCTTKREDKRGDMFA